MADVRDASNSERPCRASSRPEKPHATVHDGIDRPSVVRLDAVGHLPTAGQVVGRVECRRRWLEAVGVSAATVPTVPVLVLRSVGPEGSGLKRSTQPKAVAEQWRLIATNDGLKLRASACAVKPTTSMLRLSR